MDSKKNKIIDYLQEPKQLETLYQENPKQFLIWFDEAVTQHPDSTILQVWQARLSYTKPTSPTHYKKLFFVIIASFIATILIKSPEYTPISENWFYSRFPSLIMIGALILYFMHFFVASLQQKQMVIGVFLSLIIVIALLPSENTSDSTVMSLIHLPLVLFSLLGISYMAEEWRSAEARLRYIRYLGDTMIYTVLILIGGIILTSITLGLFKGINLSIESWYMSYIIPLGLVAAPLVATFLYDEILGRESKLATLIANTFAPLFLVTVIGYLLTMLVLQKNPYMERDFLIIFNGLLLIVWGISVFSLSERVVKVHSSKLSDFISIALILTTLVINIIALSAILFRLVEYGITVNRIVVIGANILIFIHLSLILNSYLKFIKQQITGDSLIQVIGSYLPIYTAWSMFVVVVLPVVSGFA